MSQIAEQQWRFPEFLGQVQRPPVCLELEQRLLRLLVLQWWTAGAKRDQECCRLIDAGLDVGVKVFEAGALRTAGVASRWLVGQAVSSWE